ncbi:MAG: tandem-95 repeat protein, partial [Spirochaetales bacterium]|nr:tandem-95 repeat protein [Spirochaetales bacterium]
DPVAVNDSDTTNEDTAVTTDVLANDSDADGDALSIASVGSAGHGTTEIIAGQIRYTPDANYFGTDSYMYTTSDGNGGTDIATVTITITGINDNPIGVNDSTTTNEETLVYINVLSNDSDPDNDTLTIASVGSAAHGATVITMGQIRYTPTTNFFGIDSFSYTVSDGNGGSDTATVTVTVNGVNDNPAATNDSAATNEDSQVDIDVLSNDTDVDGDTLSIANAGTASNGTTAIISGQIRYTPNANFSGTDSFMYTASDGNGGTDIATVTITITGINDNPVAFNDSATTNEETQVLINVLANDTDVDGDTLTISNAGTASNGITAIISGQIRYTPDTNFYGTDTFSYTVSDGHGGSDTATVTVTVNGVNDDPVAVNDSAATNEESPVTINVLNNDTDADGDSLNIASVGSASHGATVITMGQIQYTPDTNYNGTDTFSYSVSDGNGGTDTATVTVTINGVNDNPVAFDDSGTVNEDSQTYVDVLNNDTDIDGDTLTIAGVGTASHGTAVSTMGQIRYTPAANYNGPDTFTYTVSDGHGGTDNAAVTITVNAVNDNPVAIDDSATTNEDSGTTIDVLINDTDIDGDSLTIASVGAASHGNAVISAGRIDYTPNAGYFGTDSFSYTVSDGNGGTDTGSVTVTIIEIVGPTPEPTPLTTLIPGEKHIIYDDTLNDWVDDSYICTPNYSASSPTYEGNASIEFTMSSPYCVLSLNKTGESVDMSAYTHLDFYIHGGSSGGQIIDIYIGDESNTQIGDIAHVDFYVENGSIAPDTWRIVEVPIEAFNAGTNLCGYINLKNNFNGTQNPVYIDYIAFANNPSGPTPIPTPGGITPEPTQGPTGITTNGVLVQYKCGEALAFNNHIKPHMTIRNTSANNYPLSELTLRYYYTKEGASEEESFIDHSTPASAANVMINFREDASSIYRYMEIGFTGSAGTLLAGSTQTLELRFNKIDWTDYNEVDDYSYEPSLTAYTDWDRVTLYHLGTLVWGTEPAPESTPEPTPEPTPDTTPEPTPGTSLSIHYVCGNTTSDTNQIKFNLNIFNNGSSAVTLSNLTIRYYYSKEGTAGEEFHADYAVIGSGNVNGQFFAGYLEIGFTAGAGDLAAGGNTGEMQLRFNKLDWSNYIQEGDYSFDPTKTGYAEWDHITIYNNSTRVWGIEP